MNTGDSIYVGSNSNLVNRSKVRSSFNSYPFDRVLEDYGDRVVDALKVVAERVHTDGDEKAVELFEEFTTQLVERPDKRLSSVISLKA